MHRLTIISSAVIIASVVSYLASEQILAEWRGHQNSYSDFLYNNADNDADRAFADEFSVELRQAYLPDLKRVDRCASCHVGIENPKAAGLEQPLSPHPGNYLMDHDVEKFGCTICHDGQGRATANRDSKGKEHDLFYEWPMLGQPFMQSRCYRCHTEPLEETPVYNKGKELFAARACIACHAVDGVGGTLGPALDGLSDASPYIKHATETYKEECLEKTGHNANLAFIYESIKYPKAQPADSIMMVPGLTDDDVVALTTYLKGFEPPVVVAKEYIK